MRTKEEAYKMFKEQEGKSATEIINWYKDELQGEKHTHFRIIHDWEDGYLSNLTQLNGSDFNVSDVLTPNAPNTRLVTLRKVIDDHKIIRIAMTTRL